MESRIAQGIAYITLSLFYLFTSWTTPVIAERRNISEIRYHFTPCGVTGRLGPTHEQCVHYYTSIDSPIVRDGVLTDTYSSGGFSGSQSFRSPRDTAWNIKIAGAAGGRGLCNLVHGLGLVQYLESVTLTSEQDLIVMVGQKGLGPCETMGSDPGHMLCENPPQSLMSAEQCSEIFGNWSESADVNINFSGGAGGGGASYLGTRQHSSLFIDIIGISGGGGGTSSDFSYYTTIKGDILSTIELYTAYIDAKPITHNNSISRYFGSRGDGILTDIVTAGAGGGYSESIYEILQRIPSDGRGFNMTENFAEGGKHCLENSETVPRQLKEAAGGFGGGGGGCLEGGGGGGFTGGAVAGITKYTPGSGGFSINSFSGNLTNGSFEFNNGDGFVDIVAADCGCVGECVIYEEEDQFECFCPNNTNLAPDLSDCYHSEEQRATTYYISATGNEFRLRGVNFSNNSHIYSVDAYIYNLQTIEKREVSQEMDGDACVLIFIGENDDIVLVANTIFGYDRDRSDQISRVIKLENGTLTITDYTSFLETSVFVTGAILASTGSCSLYNHLFNVSIQPTENEDSPNFDEIAADIYNRSSPTHALVRKLLNLSDNENKSNFTTLIISLSIATAIALGIVGAVAITTFVCIYCRIRSSPRPTTNTISLFTEDGHEILLPLNHMTRPSHEQYVSDKELQSNPSYVNMQSNHSNEDHNLQSNAGYETMDFGGNDEGTHGHKSFKTKYGVDTTVIDFTVFNRQRADSTITDWEYPRSDLIFMRDLGEGQFGKVMLMKATSIAGYRGDVPVAVKTLSSRDPDIIQKFMEETELMKKFTHPNIVSLLGVCNMSVKDDSAPLMILEYMPYGDLRSFLEGHKPSEKQSVSMITDSHFYKFAMDVAKALDFLSSKKYVHRDIAARNCLVGADLLIKIADFGLARGLYDKDYYRIAGQSFLPVRWMAPECLLFGVFTTASDVWAYGVLLWEITSYGLTPLNDYVAQEIIDMAQDNTLKHNQPPSCPDALYTLIKECHHLDNNDRPSFSTLAVSLETIMNITS